MNCRNRKLMGITSEEEIFSRSFLLLNAKVRCIIRNLRSFDMMFNHDDLDIQVKVICKFDILDFNLCFYFIYLHDKALGL